MLWARFGEATLKAPHAIQWLSDNGPQYTATPAVLYAHELGLAPITTPAYSPESNGLAEAFIGTLLRLRNWESLPVGPRVDRLGGANGRDGREARGARSPRRQ
jgi:transposase InsO family protein